MRQSVEVLYGDKDRYPNLEIHRQTIFSRRITKELKDAI